MCVLRIMHIVMRLICSIYEINAQIQIKSPENIVYVNGRECPLRMHTRIQQNLSLIMGLLFDYNNCEQYASKSKNNNE